MIDIEKCNLVAPTPENLQTERLALRRFTLDDFDWLHRLNSDPRVTEHMGGTKTPEQSRAMLDVRILDYYDKNPGLGMWVTLDRASGAMVGFHLLNHIQGEAFIQLGYMLPVEGWGKGYATEMSIALLRYGFGVLKLPRIVAITNRANLASQHVLLKAGLARNGERTFAHPAYADGNPFAWFERDREDWLAADASR